MTNEQLTQSKRMMDLGLILKFISNYYNTTTKILRKKLNEEVAN